MKKENFENFDYLSEQVFPRFGVDGVFNKKLEAEMDKGVPIIELKAQTTYDENKIQFTFNVEKSESDNRYYLNRVDAQLTRKNGEVQDQTFRIYNQRGMDIKQMYNVMEGRFVYREYLREGERKSGWSFVDHNRKDDMGKPIVRTYSDDITKFNLVAAVSKIPMPYMSQTDKEAMLTGLRNGDPISAFVKMPDGTREKADLVVQPNLNVVFAYDKAGNKINFDNKQSKVVAVDDMKAIDDGKNIAKGAAVLEQSMNGQQTGQGKKVTK